MKPEIGLIAGSRIGTHACTQLESAIGLRGDECGKYTLSVKVALTAKRNQQAVEELLADIVPANMVCTTSLLYNQHADLTRFTHAQLALLTHFEIREEVLPDGE